MKKSESQIPYGYELRPKAKTAHLQLLLVPETLELLKELAVREHTSMNALGNEAIHRLLEERGMIQKGDDTGRID